MRTNAAPVPSRAPRPEARLDVVGALIATAAAAAAYLVALRMEYLPPAPASTVFFTVTPIAAAVALPVFLARARAERDEALAWFAVGLGATLVAMVLQLMAWPLIAPGGGLLQTSNDSTALLYVLFHQWVLLGALAGALGLPGRWRPWFLAVSLLISVLAALDLLPSPRMFTPQGRFSPILILAEYVLALLGLATVTLWMRRVGRSARPLRAWVAVALSLSIYDLLFNAIGSARFDSAWWSSLSMRVATYVVLAVGALRYVLAELARLEQYTDRELGRSEHELRRSLAVTDRLLISAENLSRAVSPREVAQAVVASSLSLTGLPRASVALVDADAGRLRTIAAVGYDDESLRMLRDYSIQAPLPAAVALVRGDPIFLSGLSQIRSRFPSWVELPVHKQTATVAVLPLRSAGQVVGVLVVSGQFPKPWSAMDKEVLAGVAAQAGQALQRALLYERQRSAAALLQQGLLPEQLPAVPGLGMVARYLPGAEGLEVGGDWYDAIPVTGGRVALVIGDVMGKGVGAATRMGQIRTAVRVLCALDPSPSAVVAGLDAVARQLDEDQIVTLVYALLDPITGQARIARVGHLPPLLVLADGSVSAVEVGGSPPLGTPDVQRAEASFEMPPASLLVLYTDGLVEDRHNSLDRGLPTLVHACAVLAAAAPAVPDEAGPLDGPLNGSLNGARSRSAVTGRRPSLDEFADDLLLAMGHAEAARDDVCLLLARTAGNASSSGCFGASSARNESASIRLPASTSTPARARRFVREYLSRCGTSTDAMETVLLLCSEMVTNAVLHAHGPVDLRVGMIGDRVRLSVRDPSPRLPVRRELNAASPGGRGMHLVTALADDWGVEVDDGKTVWAECDVHSGRPQPAARATTGSS